MRHRERDTVRHTKKERHNEKHRERDIVRHIEREYGTLSVSILLMLHDIVNQVILELGHDLKMAVWGWHTFIEEIQDFRSRADKIGTASSAYTHYVIERLKICVQALSNVLLHLNELHFKNDYCCFNKKKLFFLQPEQQATCLSL